MLFSFFLPSLAAFWRFFLSYLSCFYQAFAMLKYRCLFMLPTDEKEDKTLIFRYKNTKNY